MRLKIGEKIKQFRKDAQDKNATLPEDQRKSEEEIIDGTTVKIILCDNKLAWDGDNDAMKYVWKTAVDLEKEFDITRSTASKNVDLLVENGFIVREQVDYDARLKKLVLTEKAKEVLRGIIKDLEPDNPILPRLKQELGER